MPLDKSGSKAAFSNNVKAEVAAGKPQKQAVAIAYSVARERPAYQSGTRGPRKTLGGGLHLTRHRKGVR